MRLLRHRRQYRPRLFEWLDADTIGAAALLLVFFYVCLVGLPVALPEGLAGSIRGQLFDTSFTIKDHR